MAFSGSKDFSGIWQVLEVFYGFQQVLAGLSELAIFEDCGVSWLVLACSGMSQ